MSGRCAVHLLTRVPTHSETSLTDSETSLTHELTYNLGT
jgi:hypothetical protein